MDQLDKIDELAERLSDVRWRLSNLYKVVNKHGEVVTFTPNRAQLDFLNTCAKRDIILKARQLGMTTLACLVALDECLFNDNWASGIIAHNLNDANKIFETKIKFPYDNLPPEIRATRPAVNDRAGTLKFSNGSNISVSTSFRSGTLQRLHVSEFGKICAKTPDRAKEIVTGAFPAAENGAITIESTAEGQDGYYYDMTMDAMSKAHREKGPRDYKFHFYPWYDNPEYRLDDPLMAVMPSTQEYFRKLEMDEKLTFTTEQIRWYQSEMAVLGGDMKREHPSTPREAFEQAIEGAYFEGQLLHATRVGSIGRFPHNPKYDVNTFWDLGRNDKTTIWFHQHIGGRNRFIGYYENSGEDIAHYIHWLKIWAKEHGAYYDQHYLPHDGDRQSLWLPEGTLAVMDDLGFHPQIVKRTNDKMAAINAARAIFTECDFDEQACEKGLKRLRMYRKDWDEQRGVFRDRPRHDDASHGADSFLTFAQGFQPPVERDEFDDYDPAYGNSSTTGY